MSWAGASPDELVALVPHLLGFHPRESMVVLARTRDGGGIVIRVDQPLDMIARADATRAVVLTLSGPAWAEVDHGPAPASGPPPPAAGPLSTVAEAATVPPEDAVTVLCFTKHRYDAEASVAELQRALAQVGRVLVGGLWVSGEGGDEGWVAVTSDGSGPCRPETAARVAGLQLAQGRQPAASRETLERYFDSDAVGVASVLAWCGVEQQHRQDAEQDLARLTGLMRDPLAPAQPLSDRDAARILLAVQDHPGQYLVMLRIYEANAAVQRATWTDLCRRAPDNLRGPVAALASFACWQAGDGVAARCALEQVPADARHDMLATLMRSTLTAAFHPRQWQRSQTLSTVTREPVDLWARGVARASRSVPAFPSVPRANRGSADRMPTRTSATDLARRPARPEPPNR